jgi:hypothetical protein
MTEYYVVNTTGNLIFDGMLLLEIKLRLAKPSIKFDGIAIALAIAAMTFAFCAMHPELAVSVIKEIWALKIGHR